MLKIGLLGLGLIAGSLFAQDNSTAISTTTLHGYSAKFFQNGDIKLYDNSKLLKNENVDVILYTPNHKEITYKNIDFKQNKYHINTDFSQKGKYTYVVKFSNFPVGVNHFLRGNINL